MKSRKDFYTQEEYYEYMLHYYAGMAMQALLSSPEVLREGHTACAEEWVSRHSVMQAKSLLLELQIPKQ
jgi:hypothetical protein